MRDNNKGFSYVELILVLAIMAMMIAMIGISYGLVTRNNVSKACAKMESVFNTARITSLSKGSEQGALNLKTENGIIYYGIGKYDPAHPEASTVEWVKFAQSPVYITLVDDSGNKSNLSTTVVTFKYNPSSGAFKMCDYSELIFSNSRTESSLKLFKATGKCKVE